MCLSFFSLHERCCSDVDTNLRYTSSSFNEGGAIRRFRNCIHGLNIFNRIKVSAKCIRSEQCKNLNGRETKGERDIFSGAKENGKNGATCEYIKLRNTFLGPRPNV